MPQFTIAPGVRTLLPLANETRADSTSAWKGCGIPMLVEKEEAFVFRTKCRRSAGQLEATARTPALLMGLLVDRRITIVWLPLHNYGGRNWWEGG